MGAGRGLGGKGQGYGLEHSRERIESQRVGAEVNRGVVEGGQKGHERAKGAGGDEGRGFGGQRAGGMGARLQPLSGELGHN